jgi:hypothetical protein
MIVAGTGVVTVKRPAFAPVIERLVTSTAVASAL